MEEFNEIRPQASPVKQTLSLMNVKITKYYQRDSMYIKEAILAELPCTFNLYYILQLNKYIEVCP